MTRPTPEAAAPIIITYKALRAGGADARCIRACFPDLRAAGISIPRDYTTLSVDLLTLLHALGVKRTLRAAYYARVDDPRLRLFACDCVERILRSERKAGREADSLCWTAIEVARRHASKEATDAELCKAKVAVMNVAGIDVERAAWSVAMPTAGAAAEAAAGAAWYTAWLATRVLNAAEGTAATDAEYAWQYHQLTSYLTGAR